VRRAGHRPLHDRPALAHDVDHEPPDAEAEVAGVERVRGGRDQPDARGDLRRERADPGDEEQPEQKDFQDLTP